MNTSGKENSNDFIIALAWPKTPCRQAGGWYDGIMRILKFNKNYFYMAGHAALVLVEHSTGKCHYFDFGRYHSPFAHGRVRSADTDHELEVKTQAVIKGDKIVNFREILEELQANSSCHGKGPLYGSFNHVNFQKAWDKALTMQQNSPIVYGPFIRGGTNCSRFVSTVIRAGLPLSGKIKLLLFVPATPTPMNNVKNLGPVTKIDSITTSQNTSSTEQSTTLRYA
jgi:hypothetical protein